MWCELGFQVYAIISCLRKIAFCKVPVLHLHLHLPVYSTRKGNGLGLRNLPFLNKAFLGESLQRFLCERDKFYRNV